MYVSESIQILYALERNSLSLSAHSCELIEKLHFIATDLRCREAPPPPTPQFAIIYGKDGKTKEGRGERENRSPTRGESRREHKKPMELTDNDDLELSLPATKKPSSALCPDSPQKAPRRQIGEPRMVEMHSPQSDNEFNKGPFAAEDGSRSPSPDPPLPDRVPSQKRLNLPLHASANSSVIASLNGDSPEPTAEDSDEAEKGEKSEKVEKVEKALPDLRLPHLQKHKLQMPAIALPPAVLSPIQAAHPLSHSLTQQQSQSLVQTPSVC